MSPGRRAIVGIFLGSLLVAACSSAPADGGPSGAPSSSAGTAGSMPLPQPVSSAGARVMALADAQLGRIELDSPDWMVTTPGALWVKLDPGQVVRLDPSNAKVRAEVAVSGPEEFELCQGFASSGDAVWTCTPYGTLARIDPRTNKATNVGPRRAPRYIGRYVAADDRLWMVEESGALLGIPLRGAADEVRIRLGATCTELAAGGGAIWAVCPDDDVVLRVDLDERAVTGRVALPVPRTVAASDQVFVAYDGGVAQLDPSTLAVQSVYAVQAGAGAGLWADPDDVWVRCDGGPFLVHIDPEAHVVTTIVTAEDLPSGGNVVAMGDELWATAYDDGTLVRLRPPT